MTISGGCLHVKIAFTTASLSFPIRLLTASYSFENLFRHGLQGSFLREKGSVHRLFTKILLFNRKESARIGAVCKTNTNRSEWNEII